MHFACFRMPWLWYTMKEVQPKGLCRSRKVAVDQDRVNRCADLRTTSIGKVTMSQLLGRTPAECCHLFARHSSHRTSTLVTLVLAAVVSPFLCAQTLHAQSMKRPNIKWYLRDVTNAILDQAIHVDGITEQEALKLLMEDAFQEQREAAGKWKRAQLTAAQLSTYFVGYLEHVDLRRDAEIAWGNDFNLKTYHDKILSFGSPPVQYVRALLLNRDVPLKHASRSRGEK